MNDQWRSRITIEPGKRSGRPCIRGMRITVYDVLSYLAAGMTVAEVLADFPYLTPEDIQACFAFAAERERSLLVAVAWNCFLTKTCHPSWSTVWLTSPRISTYSVSPVIRFFGGLQMKTEFIRVEIVLHTDNESSEWIAWFEKQDNGVTKTSSPYATWHIFFAPIRSVNPDLTIRNLCNQINSLPDNIRQYWTSAFRREFFVGYHAGPNGPASSMTFPLKL